MTDLYHIGMSLYPMFIKIYYTVKIKITIILNNYTIRFYFSPNV